MPGVWSLAALDNLGSVVSAVKRFVGSGMRRFGDSEARRFGDAEIGT